MEKTAMIIDLYFVQKKKTSEIADIVSVTPGYISQIVAKDKRYKNEKQRRKDEQLIKRRELQKKQIYSKRKNKASNHNTNIQILQQMHNQDVSELSEHKNIGNQSLRKWCSSAYKYNLDKKKYEFDTERLTRTIGFPLYIKA